MGICSSLKCGFSTPPLPPPEPEEFQVSGMHGLNSGAFHFACYNLYSFWLIIPITFIGSFPIFIKISGLCMPNQEAALIIYSYSSVVII